MPLSLLRRLFCPLLFAFCLPLAAQYTVKSIALVGAEPYPEPAVLRMVPLKAGDPIGKAGLDTVSRRLMDTGYFANVEASLDFVTAKEAVVRMRVKPVPRSMLLPISFDNLVWLSSAELTGFRQSMPLLALGIPEAGNRPAEVEAALNARLAALAPGAVVTHTVIQPTTLQPYSTMSFRVEPTTVRLAAAHLAGIPPEFAPAERAALAKAQHTSYNDGTAGDTTASILLTPFADAGDLDAKLEITARRVKPAAPGADVDLDATVQPGSPYTVSAISFAPSALVSQESFARTQTLKPGAPASRKQLLATVEPVLATYRAQGYVDVYVDPHPVPDSATHQVAYSLTVEPGQQYRLATLNVTGLPPAARADFDKAFPLHVGDLYNESAVGPFLTRNSAISSLLPFAGTYAAAADPNTHTVELTLEFHPMGAGR